MKFTLGVLFFMVLIYGCKKSEVTCGIPNKGGAVKFTFISSPLRHDIIASKDSSDITSRKISAPGLTADSMHLVPGTWTIFVIAVDSTGKPFYWTQKKTYVDLCTVALFPLTF